METISGLGKLVIVGPAEDETLLRRYWSNRYGSNANLDRSVEYVISNDDQWRLTIHLQIWKADCILFHLAPKGSNFPQIRRPKMRRFGFEEYYSAPLHDGSSGYGLLHEIVYLRRLGRIRQTIVLCTSKDFKYIDQILRLAPLMGGVGPDLAPLLSGYWFKNTPKGLQATTPRFSAFDKQLVSLGYAHTIITFTMNQVRDPLRSGFSQKVRPVVQRVVRNGKWRRKFSWWRRSRPNTLLGKSSRPRRLPPDNGRKIIQFTNVEDLVYIPRFEITEISLAEVLDLLSKEEIELGCPSCNAPLSRIFFFVRSLHRESDDLIRGRCQQCLEPVTVENSELIWFA